MQKILPLIIMCTLIVVGNIDAIPGEEAIAVKGKFSRNKKCVRCHLDIYKEFKYSAHRLSNITNNAAHKAMWRSNPLSQEQKYLCAKCHAPAAENIEALMSGDAVPDPKDKSLTDGVSCAMCHRIEDIHPTSHGDQYKVSSQKRLYRGVRKSQQESEYHKIDVNNTHFVNSNVCLTCHAQHKKQKQLVVNEKGGVVEGYCVFSGVDAKSAKIAQNSKEENCIDCHMPQVRGSFTDRFDTDTHASHTFAALSTMMPKPERYIDLNLSKTDDSFTVTIHNKITHDLILHPTRIFKLKVFVNDDQIEEVVFRKAWKQGSAKPLSWLKKTIVYPDNLLAKSSRAISVKRVLTKEDSVRAELGYHTFNPALAKKIGLESEKHTKYRVLINKTFKK